jgi:hypothetical protein
MDYRRATRVDRGAGSIELRYLTCLEKFLAGGAGQAHAMMRAHGESNVSAAAANSAALTAANVQRTHRSGKKDSAGNALTLDSK